MYAVADLAGPSAPLHAQDFKSFALAGSARFTLVSRRTGTRFTYWVRAGDDPTRPIWFVRVLTGSDNENDYTYLGTISANDLKFWHGRKSPISSGAPSARAFEWSWNNHLRYDHIPDGLEVWHEGRCGRCGRTLTTPESVARGIGPECAEKMGL